MVLVAVGGCEFGEIHVFAVEAWGDVAGFLGAFDFAVEGGHHFALDGLAALGVDGVGDVGVELEAGVTPTVTAETVAIAVLISLETTFIEVGAAVIAEAGAEVIFVAAAGAVVGELSTGHGEEEPVVSFDQFNVANDEGIVEGQGAERLEPVVLVLRFAELNPDVGQAHRNSP